MWCLVEMGLFVYLFILGSLCGTSPISGPPTKQNHNNEINNDLVYNFGAAAVLVAALTVNRNAIEQRSGNGGEMEE